MEKDIDRIPKNADTDIIIRIDDFGGKRGITIREFVRGERYTGFTKAGTRIPADKFKVFKQAINSISEEELMAGIEELESVQPNMKNTEDSMNEKPVDKGGSKGKGKSAKQAPKEISEDDIGEEEF